jgi:hypothetical protein
MERALKSEKARKLKSELDEALDRWRKQVLEVQSKYFFLKHLTNIILGLDSKIKGSFSETFN